MIRGVPSNPSPWQTAAAVNAALSGKLNCTADLTLTPDATETEFRDPRLTPASVLCWMPTTASAAAAAPSLYVTGRTSGAAVFHHAAAAAVDQTFSIIIIG